MTGSSEPHQMNTVGVPCTSRLTSPEPSPETSPGTSPGTSPETTPGRHGLGPHVVGQRVVVRRLLPADPATGERPLGPSGGPGLTDVLGICEAWSTQDDGCVIRREDGTLVRVPVADIVSGKPVPPRASVRARVPAVEVHRRAGALFPGAVDTPLPGASPWWVRLAPGDVPRRARTVLALTPPDPADDVRALLAAAAQSPPAPAGPRVTVVADSEEETLFRDAGWRDEQTDEPPVLVQVAALAPLARALRPHRHPEVGLTEESATAATVAVTTPDGTSTGRGGLAEDWLVVGALATDAAARRRGLARAVLAGLVDWAAESGAHTAHLQVRADNAPAIALYEALGFRTHHRYRYLVPPR